MSRFRLTSSSRPGNPRAEILPSNFDPQYVGAGELVRAPVYAGEWPGAASQTPSQLLEYLHVLQANFLWIALLAGIGAASGWLVASMRPAMYQARTLLDIRSLNDNFLNSREGSPIGTNGGVLPESYIQTEIKILSSDSLRKRALGRMEGVQERARPQTADSPSWWSSMFARFEPGAASFKAMAEDSAHRVKVRAVGNTRIVEVLCDARDGQLAANMCNNLAKTYIEYNLESRYQSTKETGDWLQSQLDDVRRRLTKAENELKDSSRETSIPFDPDSPDNAAVDKLRQLQAELSRSQADRIDKESNYVIATSRPVDSLPPSLDAGPIREYRSHLEDLKRQLAEMTATMTPEHYKVREMKNQIAEVERALNKEHEDLINRLKADYEEAQHREAAYATVYNKQAAQVSERGDKAVRYEMLKRDVDSDRKLYETLLQRVDEVGLAAALRTSTISVLDPATAPAAPYSPHMLASVGIGFFGGSILGFSLAFVRFRADRTLRGPGEAALFLNLRELGVIPSVRNRRMRLLLARIRPSLAGSQPFPLNIREPAAGETQAISMPRSFHTSMALATWLRVPELSEAFFGAMSSLRFATERGERANVIVLTSPEPGEGKTTVATNLATALAMIGRRVILVDGDLRRPGLDRIFETACEGGLAALLESEDPIEEKSLARFIVKTAIPNLSVLPTKAAREGISRRLHSSRMRLLVERLRQEFDTVVIDSPPMLQIADARVLGWLADGVLLVLRARRTTRDSAAAAYDRLFQDGINVLGTVLNDWNPGKTGKYGSYSPYMRVS